ncbi:MAG: hypothetical protein ACRDT4_27620, partial [Micromonosporaceae bacterium]
VGRGVIGAPGGAGGFGGADGGGGARVIGGGPRPGVGVPAEPPPGPGQPGQPGQPGPLSPGRGAEGGGGRRGRRTSYERGEPELFVDQRQRARPVLGQQPAPTRPVDPGPGVIGQQKQKPSPGGREDQWRLPQPAPEHEGLPDKLEDGTSTRRDGTRFTVRRHGSGS